MDYFRIGELDDGLVLIQNGLPVGGILLQNIQGFEGPEQRVTSFPKPGGDGGTVSGQKYDERFIELGGMVEGRTLAEFEDLRRQLINAVRRRQDDSGYPQAIRVYFTTLGGSSYYADCYFHKPVMALDGSPIDCQFLVTGRAPDPFIYGNTTVSTGVVSPPSGGGFIMPVTVPIVSAASVGGSVTVSNAGSEDAHPIITMTGPLTTPVATNNTTGNYIQLAYTLAIGETVTIDMKLHTITLDGGSLISTKRGDWWTFVPGTNVVTLTTTNSGDAGTMIAEFNPPYVGV